MGTNFFDTFKQILKTIAMILSWTIFGILVLIIGFLVYYLVSANIYASKGEKFEPVFSLYTIVSPSMEPNIKVYDVILNTKIDDPNKIKIGDVITFISTSNISNGMTVTHRVTDIIQGPEGLEFKTKGDNNLSEDTDTAKANNVMGKVFLRIPQLGRLQFFLSSNGGWLIVIVCPALFIIISDIFKILKLNKAKKAIVDAEGNDNNDDKIVLESFRKEKLKKSLKNKDLEKANKLADNMKDKKKEKNESKIIDKPIIEKDVEEENTNINKILEENNTQLENNQKSNQKSNVVIEENINIEEDSESERVLETKISSVENENYAGDENEVKEIMFIPVIEESDINEDKVCDSSESNVKNEKKSYPNSKKKKKNSTKKVKNNKKQEINSFNNEEYNIFGEKVKQDNIFTKEPKIVKDEEKSLENIKKTDKINTPKMLELPKLKDEK